MESKLKKWVEYFASLSGVLGPLIMGFGMLVSGLGYRGIEGQRYNLANHFVSELGELGVSEWAALFNGGLLLGGCLITIFMVYLATKIKHWVKYPLGLLSVYTTINGALVGVYPMNFLEPHIKVAMRFFNLGMLMTFFFSILFIFTKWHPFPRWMAIPGLLNAVSFAWFLNTPSDFDSQTGFDEAMHALVINRPDFIPLALLEWVVVLGILIFVLMLGFTLFYTLKKSEVTSP